MGTRGRIVFAGNPWPEGHAVEEVRWAGRLDPATGVWFDLHLVTAEYSADDEEGEADDEGEPASDWESKGAWHNYHRCILSSLHWGEHAGLLVGTRAEPLDFATLSTRRFAIDPLPLREPSFGIYLLGHDSVAAHEIRFEPTRSLHQAAIRWWGKIALSYGGETSFDHAFSAKLAPTRFEGFRVVDGVTAADAREALRACVLDAAAFRIVKREGTLWLVAGKGEPKTTTRRVATRTKPKAKAAATPIAKAKAKPKAKAKAKAKAKPKAKPRSER